MSKIEGLGYLKYTGKLVEDGYMDARKSAEALMGFDDAIRYFIVNEHPELKNVALNIPVKVQEGSWLALLGAGLGIIATAYFSSAASTVAENDFKNISSKDILRVALRKMQGVMKIALHLKGFTRNVSPKFKQNNTIVSLINDSGQVLEVPLEFLKLYLQINPKMFASIAGVIEPERVLRIGIFEGEGNKPEEIEVTPEYKHVFAEEEEPTDVILPELEHGKRVELIGEIPKGNERSNIQV